MTDASYDRALRALRERFAPPRPTQVLENVAPLALFPGEDRLYAADRLSNSLLCYSTGPAPELLAAHALDSGRVTGFAGYDPESGAPWLLDADGALHRFDAALRPVAREAAPFAEAFFFTKGGRRFLLSLAVPSEGLVELGPAGPVPVLDRVPFSLPGDGPAAQMLDGGPVVLLMDSGRVLRFDGTRFVSLARPASPGRLLALRRNPDAPGYVTLSEQANRATLRFYDAAFRPARRVLLRDAPQPGGFCLSPGCLHVGSAEAGYLRTYALNAATASFASPGRSETAGGGAESCRMR